MRRKSREFFDRARERYDNRLRHRKHGNGLPIFTFEIIASLILAHEEPWAEPRQIFVGNPYVFSKEFFAIQRNSTA
jgi:hypothetical protein